MGAGKAMCTTVTGREPGGGSAGIAEPVQVGPHQHDLASLEDRAAALDRIDAR
jgi:hypothetical protein